MTKPQHMSDVARMNILYEEGGKSFRSLNAENSYLIVIRNIYGSRSYGIEIIR